MWAPNDKRWLYIFFPFLLIVVGLLVWLNACGVPQMEGEDAEKVYEGILVSELAPEWVSRDLELIDSHLPEHRKLPRDEEGELVVEFGEPDKMCTGEHEGEEIQYPCKDNWISFVPWDQRLSSCTENDCEAGISRWSGSACTIMVPNEVEDVLPIEVMTLDGGPDLHNEVEAILATHEIVHCQRGEGHIVTPIAGPFVSIPSGHIMHPSVLELGWRNEGL